MKNFNIIDKQGIKLNTANTYVNDDINVGLSKVDKDNLVAENIKKDVTILGVTGTHEGGSSGASLNVAYGTTPPADTSKIWLECEEPQAVEVQNYLGECAVSEVANYEVISPPVASTNFLRCIYSSCYIGNNQIAIVGVNHIRIYDLTTKSYIADYSNLSGLNGDNYANVIYKDNILYFGYQFRIYSFDLSTQTLTELYYNNFSEQVYYFCFCSENEVLIFTNKSGSSYVYKYNLTSKKYNSLTSVSTYGTCAYLNYGTVKVGNYIYSFYYSSSHCVKYNLLSEKPDEFTSLKNFCTSLGISNINNPNAVYDNERFIYIIGGGPINSTYNNIIKYDTINDTFEMLDQKLISGKYRHFSELVDNRIYMFGGDTSGTSYGRRNQIDYFDLSYPLTQNNAIITTNTINTDNALPLINTEKLKLNSNIASAYKGNANNLAEKVNAYHHNGYGWVGINCDDYTIYFSWDTLPTLSCALHNNVAIDLSQYYHTNGKPTLSASVAGGGMTSNINGTVLDITNNSSSSAQTIIITATVNNTEYQTTLTVDVPATTTIDDLS